MMAKYGIIKKNHFDVVKGGIYNMYYFTIPMPMPVIFMYVLKKKKKNKCTENEQNRKHEK